MNKPLISIIVPNFNGEKYIEPCLTSVLKSQYPNFELLVVDDGSTDSSVKIINRFKNTDKRVTLVLNSKNVGLTKSRNKAIKMAKGDIVIFLDNDTQVKKDWMEHLVGVLYSSDRIGAAQSKLVDYENRKILQHAGLKLISHTAWGVPIAHKKKVKSYQISEPIIALGAALAIKKDALKAVGSFDEKLVHYTDDLDFSWRVWIAGYKIMSCPKSIVYHWSKGVESTRIEGENLSKVYFHLCKNSLRSITKNYKVGNAIKYLLTSIFINITRAFLVLFKRKDSSALSGTLKGIGWYLINIRDTLLERKKVQKTRLFTDRKIIKSAMVEDSIIEVYRKHFSQTHLLNI